MINIEDNKTVSDLTVNHSTNTMFRHIFYNFESLLALDDNGNGPIMIRIKTSTFKPIQP